MAWWKVLELQLLARGTWKLRMWHFGTDLLQCLLFSNRGRNFWRFPGVSEVTWKKSHFHGYQGNQVVIVGGIITIFYIIIKLAFSFGLNQSESFLSFDSPVLIILFHAFVENNKTNYDLPITRKTGKNENLIQVVKDVMYEKR